MSKIVPLGGLDGVFVRSQGSQLSSIRRLSSGGQVVTPSQTSPQRSGSPLPAQRVNTQNAFLRQVAAVVSRGASVGQMADMALARVGDLLARLEKRLAPVEQDGNTDDEDTAPVIPRDGATVQELLSAVDRVVETTTFDGQRLLNGGGPVHFRVGTQSEDILFSPVDASVDGLGLGGLASLAAEQSHSAVLAAQVILSGLRADIGASLSRFYVVAENIASQLETAVANEQSPTTDDDISPLFTQLSRTLVQGGASIATQAQAGKAPQSLLSLLR